MNYKEVNYSLDHRKRMLMSLNILRKYVGHEVRDIVSIGFSDLDHLILESFKGKVVSFMVPPQFTPYLSERKCEFIVGDITKQISPNHLGRFDLIIFTEVLEHILAPDEVVIGNIYSMLKPGGLICFSVPNIATFANRFRLLIGKNVCWPKKEQIEGVYGGYGHIREYTLKEAVDIMKPFQILEITGISGYRKGLKRIVNILPAGFQNTIVVVGRKEVNEVIKN